MERRIVTVLFADLVSFTTLSERLDPEDVATIQSAYFAAVREAIARYGGTIEKFIGDAAMAVFGISRAREDDAERAVRAALAVVSAVEQVGVRLGLERDVLRVRVGVNTGEVALGAPGDGDALVTGDVVNVAARLQAAAPPGAVLLGEVTALTVASAFELGPVETLALKGKKGAVRAARVLGNRPEPSRERSLGGMRALTLGRHDELQLLKAAWDSGGRVLVVAPPGIGKSRLMEEFSAASGMITWRAFVRPDVIGPAIPVAQLLESALGGRMPDFAERIERALRARGTPPARAQAVATTCTRLFDAQPAEGIVTKDRHATFEAWLEALRALGSEPTTWIVEDLHWAGEDLLAFLDAAMKTASVRFVAATARPVMLEQAPSWSAETPHHRILHLRGLERSAVTEMIEALIGRALPRTLVDSIIEKADGNPLFVEELVRMWIGVGVLVPDGREWRIELDEKDVPMPHTVQALYAAQLDDLPAAPREVARTASVAGRTFPGRWLGAVGALDVAEGIGSLVRRGLVTGPMEDPVVGPTYAFRHALLRDAAYASLARRDRAALHVRLARWLEQAADDRERNAEVIASHLDAAITEAPALARDIADVPRDDCVRLAGSWYERAGTNALRLGAHQAARALLRRAIALTDPGAWLDLARRWRFMGDATAFLANIAEGAEAYEHAIDCARHGLGGEREDEARDEMSRAVLALGLVRAEQLKFSEALDLARGALAEIRDLDDAPSARLLILHGTAASALLNDEGTALLRDRERAVAIARRMGDSQLELDATSWHVVHHIPDPTVLPSADELDAMASAAAAGGAWVVAAGVLEARAMAALFDGKIDQVEELAQRSDEIARTRGFAEGVCWADYVRCELGLHAGRWDLATAAAVRILDAAERHRYERVAVRTVMVLSAIADARRDVALLERIRAWYEPRRPRLPRSPFAVMQFAAVERRLARAGLFADVEIPVEGCSNSWNIGFRHPSWFAGAEELLCAWLAEGHVGEAQRAIQVYRDRLRNWSNALSRAALGIFESHLAHVLGEDATDSSLTALNEARGARAPWWEAKALRLLGRNDEAAAVEDRLGIRNRR